MEQLLLNIHPSPQKTLDNFVVGKNAECINSIKKLLSSTNLFFIYIWGEDGSGKSHLATALKNHKINVIEDVEKINETQQIKLFNLFNESKKTNTKLVVTGSNSPNNMGLRDDLASRLNWQLVYQLKPLTDNEKKIALIKYAEGIGASLDDKVVAYCMANLNRELSYLIATIDALGDWSLKTKRPITIPLLKQLLF
jgi:DnaA family protein|tara:strand:+ start:274 stop:861 length:588 start_codon:yes stop_codon:yes gene_type:complete